MHFTLCHDWMYYTHLIYTIHSVSVTHEVEKVLISFKVPIKVSQMVPCSVKIPPPPTKLWLISTA